MANFSCSRSYCPLSLHSTFHLHGFCNCLYAITITSVTWCLSAWHHFSDKHSINTLRPDENNAVTGSIHFDRSISSGVTSVVKMTDYSSFRQCYDWKKSLLSEILAYFQIYSGLKCWEKLHVLIEKVFFKLCCRTWYNLWLFCILWNQGCHCSECYLLRNSNGSVQFVMLIMALCCNDVFAIWSIHLLQMNRVISSNRRGKDTEILFKS